MNALELLLRKPSKVLGGWIVEIRQAGGETREVEELLWAVQELEQRNEELTSRLEKVDAVVQDAVGRMSDKDAEACEEWDAGVLIEHYEHQLEQCQGIINTLKRKFHEMKELLE